MKKAFIPILLSFILFFGSVGIAEAAALTQSQINAIIGLLRSFGADESVVANVNSALTGAGTSSSPVPSSSVPTDPEKPTITYCPKLRNTLYRGSSDSWTKGEVSMLQRFLRQLYPELPVTGYFGVLTEEAVSRFQSQYGISPVGIVGPETSKKIASLCDPVGYPIDPLPPVSAGYLQIEPSSASLAVGGSVSMQAMYQPPMPKCPEGFACPQVMPARYPVEAEWISSNPSVASIFSIALADITRQPFNTATVKGNSNGTADIKASYKSSSGTFLTAIAKIVVSGSTTTNNPPVINGIPAIPSVTKVNQSAQPTIKFTLGPGDYTREVPNWPGRPYELYIPSSYNPSRPIPLVLLLHGGGGNAIEGTLGYIGKLTCPNGNLASPKCFKGVANRGGFVLVLPSGSANPILPNVKTWNAGGGKNGYTKISKYAVEQNVDDISYFNSLLDEIGRVVNVDPNRIYATGISNGGAMSYRLACELSSRIAAIGPIASGNQFGAVESCAPKRPVPIVHIHGTADEGWPYTGGASRLADDKDGIMISVPETIRWWVNWNNCNRKPKVENLPEVTRDGTRVVKESYTRCENNSDIVHYKIIDGGHTWPQGWQYFSENLVGKTSQQLNTNEVIWEFFKNHPIVTIGAVSLPSITVVSPNGGESLVKDKDHIISWAQKGFASDGWIQLQLRSAANPSAIVKLITSSVPLGAYAGSFNWTVPTDIPDGKYLIWASAGSGSDSLGTRVLGSDFSDAPFTISSTPGTVDISSDGDSSLAALIFSLERQIEELRQILNSLLAP